MKFATAIVATTVAAVASAQALWTFPPEGPCVANCTDSVGKTFFPFYNDVDSTGPFFFTSLSYTFERGTPTTIEFMSAAGTCMQTCPMPEQNAYRASYPLKLKWYQDNKPAALARRRL
ncbi:hypothetical protein BGZ52_006203 [Haplosporangium bisporale]|uniref:Uncharacterized protein n=1 Tax=Podila verticillata NRRL 6337 TaxID=1069443 RepID=A0A086TMA5_9FUNG|nr:hypothetical protein BGZ52_006203 [Haplosporangium bisporale]KAF9207995.1 hypothetical protein BGZ59_010849 [Podila verticillata]KFH63082.1 hypothetical protein MVEG_11119 [Podila verticillata NRRL 6337]